MARLRVARQLKVRNLPLVKMMMRKILNGLSSTLKRRGRDSLVMWWLMSKSWGIKSSTKKNVNRQKQIKSNKMPLKKPSNNRWPRNKEKWLNSKMMPTFRLTNKSLQRLRLWQRRLKLKATPNLMLISRGRQDAELMKIWPMNSLLIFSLKWRKRLKPRELNRWKGLRWTLKTMDC